MLLHFAPFLVPDHRICEHEKWLLYATDFGVVFLVTLDNWNNVAKSISGDFSRNLFIPFFLLNIIE